MLFSAPDLDSNVRNSAKRLTGEPVLALNLLSRSGNNRLYRIDTPTARFALKWYASELGVSDRLNREFNALLFLNANGAAGNVPRALAADDLFGFALYEWIEGNALTTYGKADIDAAVAFIACSYAARRAPGALQLPAATEACLASPKLFAQIAGRVARLRTECSMCTELNFFLTSEFEPCFVMLEATLRDTALRNDVDIDEEIDPAARTLSPSDFSFHNALRRNDGTIVFLDFEYFGWDDPVKLVSDFLWHPAMQIRPDQGTRFVRGVEGIFGKTDADFSRRLRAEFPLFGLKWCLIVLNEFLPSGWNRRTFSGEQRSWDDVKTAQLHKARTLLADVRSGARAGMLS